MTSSFSPNDPSDKETPPREEEQPPKIDTQKPQVDNLLDYCKTHTRDMIAYILLIIGIILLFFAPFYGGLIVGLVTGVYFSKEIVSYLLYWKEELRSEGVARQLIIAGVVVAFFISAPAIFLGAAVAIAIKQLFSETAK